MNIYRPFTQVVEQFTYPKPPDSGTAKVIVFFEWGDVVVAETSATLVSGNTYSVTIPAELVDAAGTWKIKWTAKFGGVSSYFFTSFSVEKQYVDYDTFVSDYPEFNEADLEPSEFDINERKARRIIETYCGQDFQFIQNKTLTLVGNGRKSLYIPYRLSAINSVTIDDAAVTTVRLVAGTNHHIEMVSDNTTIVDNFKKFIEDSNVKITGDWGWPDVPWQIEQATELLIIDLLEDVRREAHIYGIQTLSQDTNTMQFKNGIFETTGNIDVDVLIMDFVFWNIDYVT